MRVPPGTYELDVDLEGRIVAQRTAIEVRAGQETDLGTIDLRTTFHALRVSVCDESGSPLERADVVAFEDGERVASTASDEEGVARIASCTPRLDIAAGAVGRRVRLLREARDGARITLNRGIPVALRIPQPFVDPRGARVALELVYVGDDPCRAACPWNTLELDDAGRVDALLPLPGAYEARVFLVRKSPYLRRRVELPTALRFEIDERGGSVELPVSAAALRDALPKRD